MKKKIAALKRKARTGKALGQKTGILKEITVKGGEQVTEVNFRTLLQMNGGSNGYIQLVTSGTVPTLLAQTQFVEFYNGGTSTSLFTMYRVKRFGIRASPMVGGTFTYKTLTGSFGVGPYSGSVSGPASGTEVINMADSMEYVSADALAAAPYSLTGPYYCSKKSRSISYELSESESLWNNRVGTSVTNWGDIVSYGVTSATAASNVEFFATIQFKGLSPL
jgi:hypothetical protein